MKTIYTKKQVQLAAACALALGVLSGSASAQSFAPNNDRELWVNSASSGEQVWLNGYGECWHSAYGPTPAANICNPAKVAEYVAPAPAPYVAPVVVAKAAVYERVAFDTNVLFDFDKSVLRLAGMQSLDAFVAKITGSMRTETITATGYTDRIGTDSYNQSLSERRVAAVKDYLIGKGIEAKWVTTSGKGETLPTTYAGECTGAKATNGTIACLQADRHVFLEVSGSKLKQ
jgi:OOP family OmpA-OmpF porin